MAAKPTTIDEYLAAVEDDRHRVLLEKLRATIRSAAPKAEECISYQLAAFKQDGGLVCFGAWKKHCALYPMSGTMLAQFKDELAGFEYSKGAIRFSPEKPLPVSLVKKIVKARLAENKEKRAKRKK